MKFYTLKYRGGYLYTFIRHSQNVFCSSNNIMSGIKFTDIKKARDMLKSAREYFNHDNNIHQVSLYVVEEKLINDSVLIEELESKERRIEIDL